MFTSVDYGARVDSPGEILGATGRGMGDLERQVRELGEGKGDGDGVDGGDAVGEWWAVRINSGKFGVPWGETRRVLEEGGWRVRVVVPGEAEMVGEGGGEGEGSEGREERGGRGGTRGTGRGRGRGRGKGRGKGTLDGWLK